MAETTTRRRTRRARRRRLSGAAIAGLLGGILIPGGAAFGADLSGRIQQIEAKPGSVSFLFSVPGLAEGASIDPDSFVVTVGGQVVKAQAKPAGASAVGGSKTSRSVALVMDRSGSMAEFGKIGLAKAAAKQYMAGLPADVRVSLISFADKAVVDVAPTTDRAAITRAIDAMKPAGATAMYDASALAIATLGESGSRSVLLLSDGADEGSKLSAADAAAKVKASGIAFDAVSLGAGDQVAQLRQLSVAGDGVTVTATDAAALSKAFEAAARAVQNQFLVTADVPSSLAAGSAELTASAKAGTATVTDSGVALLQAPSVDTAASGPQAAQVSSGGILGSSLFLPVAISLIFISFLAIAWLAFASANKENEDSGRINRRLKDAGISGAARKAKAQSTTVLGDGAAVRSVVGAADRAVAKRDVDRIDQRLQSAGVPLRPAEWVVVNLLVAFLLAIVTVMLTDFSIMWLIVSLVFGILLPWLVLGVKATRRQRAFYQALPDTLQLVAGSLAAGYSFPQAVDTVAKQSKGPIAEEFQRALVESRLGIPLEEALEGVATRMASEDFEWVVMALRINRRVGGNLAEVLSTVAGTLRERERLRRQVSALSAEGRLSAWVLGLLPIGLFAYLWMTNPDYIGRLFDGLLGLLMLAGGILGLIVGGLWMRKLVKMEV